MAAESEGRGGARGGAFRSVLQGANVVGQGIKAEGGRRAKGGGNSVKNREVD